MAKLAFVNGKKTSFEGRCEVEIRSLSMEELESQTYELLPERQEMLLADLAGNANVAININVGLVNVDNNQMAIAGAFNQA